jgi:hypothetical protein
LAGIHRTPGQRTRSFTRSKLHGEVLSLWVMEYKSIG